MKESKQYSLPDRRELFVRYHGSEVSLLTLFILPSDITRLGMWDDDDEAMPGPGDL